MNAKLQILQKCKFFKYNLKGNFYDIERFNDFFTFRHSTLITTLTFGLMDNFCPGLIYLYTNNDDIFFILEYI